MTPRTVAGIIIYILIAIVAYTVIRVLSDLDDDDGAMVIAWMLAMIWPAIAALAIIFIPFWLISTGIDKLIYNIQTKIIEANQKKSK